MAYHSELGIVCGHCGSPCPGGPNPCCRLYDDAHEELVSVEVRHKPAAGGRWRTLFRWRRGDE
jgi:hypothetical protein